MPYKKISELPINTSPSGDNLMLIVASGSTDIITLSGLTNFISSNIVIPSGSAGAIVLLGSLIGFDMNSIADQQITLSGGTSFIITDLVIKNASISLDTANDFQIWSSTGRTGIIIASSGGGKTSPFTILINPSNFINVSNGQISIDQIEIVGSIVYSSISTQQGVPATADVYIYGYAY
jgi:hypothetical protein